MAVVQCMHLQQVVLMVISNKTSRADNQPTVEQFVDEHKVVLDVVLRHFAEVRLHDRDHLSEEFKDESRVHVLFGRHRQPDVRPFDVKETRPSDVCDWRTHLLPGMDHVHSERVHRIPPAQQTFAMTKYCTVHVIISYVT